MAAPLKNQKHEAFCQRVVKLDSDVQAYRQAFKCSEKNAITNAYRLREIEGIQKRITELQQRSASKTTMTVTERREIAAEIARDKTVEPATRLNATVIEAKHAGEYLDRADLTSDGEALPSVMPTIQLHLPASFISRRGKTIEQ